MMNLKNTEQEYKAFCRKLERGQLDKKDVKNPEGKREGLREAYISAKEKYLEAKREYEENSKFGNKLEANEAFFTAKSKLSGVEEGKKMIELMEKIHQELGIPHGEQPYGKWISEKCDELIEQYQLFRERYVNQ